MNLSLRWRKMTPTKIVPSHLFCQALGNYLQHQSQNPNTMFFKSKCISLTLKTPPPFQVLGNYCSPHHSLSVNFTLPWLFLGESGFLIAIFTVLNLVFFLLDWLLITKSLIWAKGRKTQIHAFLMGIWVKWALTEPTEIITWFAISSLWHPSPSLKLLSVHNNEFFICLSSINCTKLII